MRGDRFTILLVEDDPAHAEIIRRNISQFKITSRLLQVGDGQSAIDYLRAPLTREDADRPRPDLVLLDLRLPRVDGLAVLGTLKGDPELRAIPVVVLTTSATRNDLAEAYHLGCNGYLVKPAGFRDFADMITALCAYWLECNQPPA